VKNTWHLKKAALSSVIIAFSDVKVIMLRLEVSAFSSVQ